MFCWLAPSALTRDKELRFNKVHILYDNWGLNITKLYWIDVTCQWEINKDLICGSLPVICEIIYWKFRNILNGASNSREASCQGNRHNVYWKSYSWYHLFKKKFTGNMYDMMNYQLCILLVILNRCRRISLNMKLQ